MKPWLSLTDSYMSDPRLRRAGLEARLVFPVVLATLNPDDGFCAADELEPAALGDVHGELPERPDFWAVGIAGLKRVGLLVEAQRRRKGGDGGFAASPGWTTPNWAKHQHPAGSRRSGPIWTDPADPADRADRSASVPIARIAPDRPVPDPTRPDPTRQPPPTPSAPPTRGAPPHRPPAATAAEKPRKPEPEPPEPATDPGDLYRRLTGRGGFVVPPAQQERLLAICRRATAEEVEARVERASGADRPLGYFLALFDGEGNPKELRDRGGGGNGGGGLRRFGSLAEWERDKDAVAALGWVSLVSGGQRPPTVESLVECGREYGEDLEPIGAEVLGWLRRRGELPDSPMAAPPGRPGGAVAGKANPAPAGGGAP